MAQTEAEIEFEKAVRFYGRELNRTGFRPDHTSSRDSRTLFLQGVLRNYCHPHWAMKRGDPGRPISDEAIVWCKHTVDEQGLSEYRRFGDFIIQGGTSEWHLSYHLEGMLPYAQPLVSPMMNLYNGANTPGYMAEPLPGGVVPTVPGCTGPLPEPEPEPEPPPQLHRSYPDENTYWKGFQDRMKRAYNDAGRQFPDPNDSDAFRRFSRCGFDIDFTINPATGRPLTASEAADKHIAELRRELGLP